MKKIMFNDFCGLTDAVLNETKTVTRRICDKPPYKVGEVVAIAQRYEDIICGARFYYHEIVELQKHAGYKNKMFVEVDLMPHHIEILDVRKERLQDITDEDCMKEGVRKYLIDPQNACTHIKEFAIDVFGGFLSAKEAYSFLIDAISGKGTWGSNPIVYRVEFKLVSHEHPI